MRPFKPEFHFHLAIITLVFQDVRYYIAVIAFMRILEIKLNGKQLSPADDLFYRQYKYINYTNVLWKQPIKSHYGLNSERAVVRRGEMVIIGSLHGGVFYFTMTMAMTISFSFIL